MELEVLSDDGEVLRLKMKRDILRDDTVPDLKPLEDLLQPAGYTRSVLLSLEDLTFIDTMQLSSLMVMHKRFCETGGKLVVHSIRPQVMEILQMLRFEAVLRIAEDERAAWELLRQENR